MSDIRAYRKRLRSEPIPPEAHGTDHCYRERGCRCSPCTRAHAEAWRNWYQSSRAGRTRVS